MAFYVTAWHELVGNVVQYCLPPLKGMGLRIRPGKEENDVQVCMYKLVDMAVGKKLLHLYKCFVLAQSCSC